MKHHKGHRKKYEENKKDRQEDYKGEIRRLRKQVQQLRRENAKLLGRDVELQELIEDQQSETEIFVEHKCPKCGSKEVKILEKLQNEKDYFFCENPYCNARGPIK